MYLNYLKTIILFGLFWLCTSCGTTVQFDYLIKGGTVYDGTGTSGKQQDVGVVGDKIAFLGDASSISYTAGIVVDAEGRAVVPGFIDPHTHYTGDLLSSKKRANLAALMQGVTTVVVGNDGSSPFPIGAYLERLDTGGVGTNVVTLVGHGTMLSQRGKEAVSRGEYSSPEEMKQLLRSSLEEGAFGMSTGLQYMPGNNATTEEVAELSKVLKEYDAIYDTHLRDEGKGLVASVEEAIEIGRIAQVHIHLSHLKCGGVPVWGKSQKVIDLVEKAHDEGLVVSANQYPWLAASSSIRAMTLYDWVKRGSQQDMLNRIRKYRPRILKEAKENIDMRGGAESFLLLRSPLKQLEGKTLAAAARDMSMTPEQLALYIVENGNASAASFQMNEEDVVRFMSQEWIVTSSDASGGHPRKYGSFGKKYREYVKEKNIISFPFFVKNSSWKTAQIFQIPQRGKIEKGFFADILVMDTEEYSEKATFQAPYELAVGMQYIFVNGVPVVENGRFSGKLAGVALRKGHLK